MSLIRFSACSTGEHHEQCRRTETVRNPKIDMKKKIEKKKATSSKKPSTASLLKNLFKFSSWI